MINNKKEISKHLWKECFQDSELFIDFYFNNIYQDANTYIYIKEEDSKPISHVQTIPYDIFINGKVSKANYISGACTTQSERGKGYMTKLLSSALYDRMKKGDEYSILIPQDENLFAFYEQKLGYKPFFYQEDTDNLKDVIDFLPTKQTKNYDIISFIKGIEQMRDFNSIRHNALQIKNIIKEFQLFEEYDIIPIKDTKNNFYGVAFLLLSDDNITIKDIFCNQNTFDYIIENTMKKYPNHNIRIVKPASNKSYIKKGMIKCLNEKEKKSYDNIGFLTLVHE